MIDDLRSVKSPAKYERRNILEELLDDLPQWTTNMTRLLALASLVLFLAASVACDSTTSSSTAVSVRFRVDDISATYPAGWHRLAEGTPAYEEIVSISGFLLQNDGFPTTHNTAQPPTELLMITVTDIEHPDIDHEQQIVGLLIRDRLSYDFDSSTYAGFQVVEHQRRGAKVEEYNPIFDEFSIFENGIVATTDDTYLTEFVGMTGRTGYRIQFIGAAADQKKTADSLIQIANSIEIE